MKKNGTLHIKSAPYHPTTNGCADRLVRTFKNTFRKLEGSGSIYEKIKTVLFTYWITPQSTTGISPAKLLMDRKLNLKLNITKQGAELSKNVFLPNVARQFKEGDEVWSRKFSICYKWIPETILCPTDPRFYKAFTGKELVKKHVDHLRKKESPIKYEFYEFLRCS